MRTSVSLVVAAFAAAIAIGQPAVARADEKSACTDAASSGQTLRDAHKLVEARDQFRICSQRECPSVVQRDCTTWLTDVEGNIPTVVLGAKDASGADAIDVKVTVDGQPFAARLDGESRPIDPGPHAFHFETADGSSSDMQAVIRQGEKNQVVTTSLKKAVAALPAPTTPVPGGAAPGAGVTPGVEGSATGVAPASSGVPLRTVGYVVGGAGVVGLALGAIFGLQAVSKKSDANCDSSNFCDPGPLSDAKNAATLSTVGFVAGGLLLAGGVALIIVGGHASAEGHAATSASLRAAPLVSTNGGGLMLGGNW